MKKPELLCPSGDMESLTAALRFGADAVYIGGPMMQLRADKAAFTLDDIKLAADTMHRAGKKLYVTVNCFATNEEIDQIGQYANDLKNAGVDAIIVSDIGAIKEIRNKSDIEIHVSTQANCQNYMAATHYYEMGASRVVLARELSIEDIAKLRDKAPPKLELEAFVHGAMCMSYSGRCLLSSYLTGRSGNRGECAQSCRWSYYIMEEKRQNEYIPVYEDERGTQILSSRDLCSIEFLDKLAEIGIDSFKIEGRMKTAFYTATVTNAYRRGIDHTADIETLKKELGSISHRPYTTGFYYGEAKDIYTENGDYITDCAFIGSVISQDENNMTKILVRNKFAKGETLEILSPLSIGKEFIVGDIIEAKGNVTDLANKPMTEVTFYCPIKLETGDMLRRRK